MTVSDPLGDALPDILSHRDDDLPNECIGIILDDGHVVRLINQARSPTRFAVGPSQLQERLEEVLRQRPSANSPIAFYHSHPPGDTTPSEIDVQFMADLEGPWRYLLHLIVGSDEVKGYRLEGGEATEVWHHSLNGKSTPIGSIKSQR